MWAIRLSGRVDIAFAIRFLHSKTVLFWAIRIFWPKIISGLLLPIGESTLVAVFAPEAGKKLLIFENIFNAIVFRPMPISLFSILESKDAFKGIVIHSV